MPVTPLEALKAVCEAWNALDIDALVALFTDDALFEDPLIPETGSVTGPEAIRKASGGGMAALSECEVTLSIGVEHGEIGMAEGKFTSNLIDTNAPFDFPFVMVVEMRDGKIARLSEYFDTRPLS